MSRKVYLIGLALAAAGCTLLDKKESPPPLVPSTAQVARQPPVTATEISAANAKAKLQQLQDEIERESATLP
jgi:hypothetical protein